MKIQKIKVFATIGLAIIFLIICIFSLLSNSKLPNSKKTKTNITNARPLVYMFGTSLLANENNDIIQELSDWRAKINDQIANILAKENVMVKHFNFELTSGFEQTLEENDSNDHTGDNENNESNNGDGDNDQGADNNENNEHNNDNVVGNDNGDTNDDNGEHTDNNGENADENKDNGDNFDNEDNNGDSTTSENGDNTSNDDNAVNQDNADNTVPIQTDNSGQGNESPVINRPSKKLIKKYINYLKSKQELVDKLERNINYYYRKYNIEANGEQSSSENDVTTTLAQDKKRKQQKKERHQKKGSKSIGDEDNSDSENNDSLDEGTDSNTVSNIALKANDKKKKTQRKGKFQQKGGKAIGREDTDQSTTTLVDANRKKKLQERKKKGSKAIGDDDNEDNITLLSTVEKLKNSTQNKKKVNIDFIAKKKDKSSKSNSLKILLILLTLLSLGALIIIGYEIKQSYNASKKLENTTITDIEFSQPTVEYNLIEDRKERDDLGIQQL